MPETKRNLFSTWRDRWIEFWYSDDWWSNDKEQRLRVISVQYGVVTMIEEESQRHLITGRVRWWVTNFADKKPYTVRFSQDKYSLSDAWRYFTKYKLTSSYPFEAGQVFTLGTSPPVAHDLLTWLDRITDMYTEGVIVFQATTHPERLRFITDKQGLVLGSGETVEYALRQAAMSYFDI